jgi:hypothetical protein
MNCRCRVLAWLASVIVLAIFVASTRGQEPKADKPDADKVPAAEAVPEDPAVAAILATKPTTPAECTRAAKILADLGQADLARGLLKKVLAAKLDSEQLADLGQQLGSPVFFDLSGRAALRPEGKRLADAVMAALNKRLQDPKRIAALVGQLQDPSPEKRLQAVIGLRDAGGAAVGPLVAVLADQARAAEQANVRAALVEMGPLARGPLVAIVEQADPKLVVQAIEVLGAANDPKAAICLLRPYLAEKSDPAVRLAAEKELKRLTNQTPGRPEAVRLLVDAAKAYFDGHRPVEGVVGGKVDLWRWDSAKRQCVAKGLAPDDAARATAARLARDAYAIVPADPQVRLLYLAAMLEAAAYENGLDRPLDEKNAAASEAKQFGVKTLDEVLKYALVGGHTAAAAAAARLLGEIGRADELLTQGGGPSPLVQALQSPDRRLRMAALEAIVRLQPVRPFAGSSYVPQALQFFAGSSGFRHALVACPNADECRDLAGLLSAAGFQADAFGNGKDLLLQAVRSPDCELALVDVTIDRPTIDILLQQLRRDPRTASLRVGLVARSGYLRQAERLAELDPLAKAFSRPHDDRSLRWQLDQLAGLAPREFVNFQTRGRQAAEALDLLAELYRSSESVYDLRGAQQSAIAALYNPKLAVKAVAVLACANSAESQRALVDAASRPTLPLKLRQAAAGAFRQNTEKHGILLTGEEIRRQYRRYNESKTQDAATQQVLGMILDCLEVSAPPKK